MSKNQTIMYPPDMRSLVIDRFAKEAKALRRHFDERFSNPLKTEPGRFVWDYWNIPGQFTALRTPAYEFFPKDVYDTFHRRLVQFGREVLGCHDVSPPWLSLYVEGCEQKIHGDLPHGPWAYVFSLTEWQIRKFIGGETDLLRDEVLQYWKQYDFQKGMSFGDVFETIEPEFNRLTVFDGRIPHGVRRVQGVTDPREGRLVIHGWFVEPRPFVVGAITPKELQKAITLMVKELEASWQIKMRGSVSYRIKVSAQGRVTGVECLAHNLRNEEGEVPIEVVEGVGNWWFDYRFAKKSKPSIVTLPLVFD